MSTGTDDGFYATDPAQRPGEAGGRSCPGCGAINDRRRELCRRCGADLDSGDELPHLAPRDAGFVPPPQPVVRPRRRWWLPALIIVLAALVALAALVLAGVGPFAASPDVDVPPADFDLARYPDQPQAVTLSDIATATTRPPEDGEAFDALNMVDDTAASTWVSDDAALPEGVPETIEVVPETAIWLAGIVLRNGDQRDTAAYEATSRLREVVVTVDGGVVLRLRLLDEGLGRQRVDLEEPVLTTAVRIEVADRYRGDVSDLAMSDLDLLGWTADAEDTEVAARRAQRLPATGQPS